MSFRAVTDGAVAAWCIAAFTTLLGCGDGPGTGPAASAVEPSTEWPGIVSGAVLPVGRTGVVQLAPGAHVAYVSLPRWIAPTASQVTFGTKGARYSVLAFLVDGGFDPRPIAAEVGDTLWFTVESPGRLPVTYSHVVRARTNPAVVRVAPGPEEQGVPLNASIFVVLSEPLDPRSLQPGTVRVFRDDEPVTGRMQFRDESAVAVEFIPDSPLVPSENYRVIATTDLVSRGDGRPLITAANTQFKTMANPSPANLTVTSFTVLEYLVGAGWHYAPQIVVTESDGKGGASIRRIDFAIPGLGHIPPVCSAGMQVGKSQSRNIFGELYGDWALEISGSTRATEREAAITVTYDDETGRRVALTARGPIVAGGPPTTYSGGTSELLPSGCTSPF